MKKKSVLPVILALTAVLFLLAACNQEAPATPTPEPVVETETVAAEPTDAPEPTAVPEPMPTPNLNIEGFPVTAGSGEDPGLPEGDWVLVFSDEFDGDALDESKWTIVDGADGLNNDLNYDSPDNVSVVGGNLVITQRQEEKGDCWDGPCQYTSGKLTTQDKFDFTYGRVEVRSQPPAGVGFHSTAWLLHSGCAGWAGDNTNCIWPPEIDIVEMLGQEPNKFHTGLHYSADGATDQIHDIHLSDASISDGFHVYAVEWEPTEVRWYFDGELIASTNDPAVTTVNLPFMLILDTVIGGDWPLAPGPDTPFPSQHLVDYVRVYQNPNLVIPEDPDNLVANSELDAGSVDPWYIWDPANGEMEVVEGAGLSGPNAIKTTNTVPGEEMWSLELIQDGVMLEEGKTYEVSFQAKADEARDITFVVQQNGGDWTEYFNQPVTLSEETAVFGPYTFVSPASVEAGVHVWVGGSDVPVYIDRVIVKETIAAEPTAVCGEFILNGEFDEGDANWLYWQQEGGDAEFSIVQDAGLSGDNAGKLTIADGGTIYFSVELNADSPINLVKGVTYDISFMAKADEARDITILLQQEGGDWKEYWVQPVSLTTEPETYTFSYTSEVDDDNARFRFELGESNVDVYVDALSVSAPCDAVEAAEPAAEPVIESVGDNMLVNGDFEAGADPWYIWDPANGEFEVADGAAKTVNTVPGEEMWSLELIQDGLALTEGQSYAVSFTAWADAERPLTFVVQQNGGDWTEYFNQEVALTSEPTEFGPFIFTSPAAAEGGAHAWVGGSDIPVYMDNIVVAEAVVTGGEAATEAEATGTPGENMAVNGDFEAETADPWYIWDPANGEIEVADGVLKVTNTVPGEEMWSLELIQDGLTLAEGVNYVVTFDAWADAERPLTFVVQQNGGDWTEYFNQEVALTTEPQSFGPFIFSGIDVTDAGVHLWVGGSDIPVYVDNVVVAELIPDEADSTAVNSDATASENFVANADFEAGADPWYIWDPANGEFEVADGAAKTVNTVPGEEMWSLELIQDGLTLAEGVNYVVTFDAWADAERPLVFVVQENGGEWTEYFNTEVALTTEPQSFGPFIFSGVDVADAGVHLWVGGSDIPVYVDNVVVGPASE